VDKQKDVKIAFTGLKEGLHEYRFDIGQEFFESFEGSIVETGSVAVDLEFEKGTNLFVISFSVSGEVETLCSRCGGRMLQEIEGDAKFFVKFGEDDLDVTDDIIMVKPHEHEIHVSQYVYEAISLALPLNPQHEDEEECDQDVLEKLKSQYLVDKETEEQTDPKWDALKGLKF
jgi:uncharacterized protein